MTDAGLPSIAQLGIDPQHLVGGLGVCLLVLGSLGLYALNRAYRARRRKQLAGEANRTNSDSMRFISGTQFGDLTLLVASLVVGLALVAGLALSAIWILSWALGTQ